MLALCLMLLGTYYTLPIMLALRLMLLGTYYAQNYASIIGRSLFGARLLQETQIFLLWFVHIACGHEQLIGQLSRM